jgi:hypothetical protein
MTANRYGTQRRRITGTAVGRTNSRRYIWRQARTTVQPCRACIAATAPGWWPIASMNSHNSVASPA